MKKNLIIAASVAALAFCGAFASVANTSLLQTVYVGAKQFISDPNWTYVPVANVPNGTCSGTSSTNCTLQINLASGSTGTGTGRTDATGATILKDNSVNSGAYSVTASFTPAIVQ